MWAGAVGSASYEDDREATPDTQYRIGSITKTFTAVAIMQLCAAGALDLDDRLEQHIEGIANGSPTIRRLLSHLSGLQREAGEMFVTGESPTEEQLIASMRDVEFVLRPGESHHYSNLAFALLGQVVARRSGPPYMEYVDERIIGPLGLERTTWLPQAPKAQGYLVDEYARTVWPEPETDLAATASAGQLWSTVGDLGRWAAFLAAGNDDVLDARLVEEMWFPQVMYDPDEWMLAWGLGLMLYKRRPDLRRPRRSDGRASCRGVRRPQDRDRRGRADELGDAREHGPVRDLARQGGPSSGRRRSRRGSPRRSRPRTSARCSAAGGRRATSSSSGGREGRCARSSRPRRPARARRSSSATATAGAPPAGASAASACGSTATG